MKDCSALGPPNMHRSCLPGLPCRIDPMGQNATEKEKKKTKHADGIFLTWLPILPLDLVKLLGTLKTGSTLKVCRRETPSAEVAHFKFIQQTRSLAVRNVDQLNLLLHPEAKASHREEWHRGERSGLWLDPTQVRTRSRRLASKMASVEPQLGYHPTNWKCGLKGLFQVPSHATHSTSLQS